VALVARSEDKLLQIKGEIERVGGAATVHPADLSELDDCERLVADVLSEHGRVDVLVNNAGVSPLYGALDEVTEELFDKVIAVNLKGPFRLCALVGRRMAAGEGGSIINISSTGAVRPTGDIVPYAAAKAGLNALTVGVAHALGPRVRVNAIMPGPFLTTISEAWDMDVLAERTRTFPLRRAGLAEEIAGAALYLAGEASSYTTGSILTVDGGAQWSVPGTGDSR
jgi:NAD(P)-dependent dehydrogenase (short-subunit alcohol dehydrogenase family)